ncbi:MAG: nitroreductase family protein [Phycisphaerae bacterium]|nr:nitroreductase family protein [Phycisphaerae bacterium]MDD5381136.1 nitroreductase family protein [Phycisphaerae bacterium]
MAVLEVIRKRYSCRAYLDKPIEKEKLEQLFEAARLAPSAKNLQDWRFVVVSEKDKKQQVAASTNHPEVFGKAGVMIAACSNSNYVMKCGQAVSPIDVAIAMEHISLQATQLQLATCWIGSFEPETVRKALGIPQDIAVIELMAVGYPADQAKTPSREPIENIVCYDKWQF